MPSLNDIPNIERLKRAAKALKRGFAAGEAQALSRIHAMWPDRSSVTHADALHVVAREHGYASWPRLKFAAEQAGMDRAEKTRRLRYALMQGQHAVVDALLSGTPDLAHGDFGLECALHDLDAVRARLAEDPGAALRDIAGRRPIVHLAFSRHLHRKGGTPDASLAIAEALVATGADVNDGMPAEQGSPHMLSVLYGAIGHADNLALGRWLLDHGADPDDNESLYHATELPHLDAVRLLLERGATIEGTNALFRMLDFDNPEGLALFLAAGADVNAELAHHPSGQPPLVARSLHHAARRRCSPQIAELLLAHGADGRMADLGHSAYALACMYGNIGFAQVLADHGQATVLSDSEAMIAAAVSGDTSGRLRRLDPQYLSDEQRRLLCRLLSFDECVAALVRLIDIGIDPNWTDEMEMPAIHVAAWCGQSEAVETLLQFAPDLEAKNLYGGDVMGCALHGLENCPEAACRDHLGCIRHLLAAGAPVHRSDMEHCGDADIVAMLEDWAEAHPTCLR